MIPMSDEDVTRKTGGHEMTTAARRQIERLTKTRDRAALQLAVMPSAKHGTASERTRYRTVELANEMISRLSK
jgi:hypothetical protein